MKNFYRLAAAVVASGTLVAAGGGGIALAAPSQLVDTTKVNNEIHIVKYDDGAGKSAPDGKQLDQAPTGAKPLAEIGFTLTPINGIDFATNDGLKAASALDVNELLDGDLPDGITLGTAIKLAPTDAGGATEATNLKVGAYILQEVDSTAADGKTYTAAQPSIIFLPTTDPEDTSQWLMDDEGNYEVWVYPKNSLEQNTKTVTDADVHAGGDVTFSVTASLPTPGPDEQISDFLITDKIDPALDIKGKEADVTVSIAGEQLAANEFHAWASDSNPDVLTVALSTEGLNKATSIKKANPSATVVMTFKAKVLRAAVVPNQAQVYKNLGEGAGTTSFEPDTPPDTPPTPPEGEPTEKTNTTTSAWGKVQINKVDEAGEALNGAEFQVFECTVTDGKASIAGDAQAISVKGETTFTTAAQDNPATQAVEGEGGVTIDGLHVNDAENDQDLNPKSSYCLVETKAPEKYELRHDPIPFDLTISGVSTTSAKYKYDSDGALISYSTSTDIEVFNVDAEALDLAEQLDIVNIKSVTPKLPLTGGAGIAIFGILGAAAIGGGLYAAKRNNRREA